MSDGFLAIWSDVEPEQETDYLHWLMREHTSERLGVDGFQLVRVYRSLQPGIRRYFIRYELRSPGVLGSEAYLARLNAHEIGVRAQALCDAGTEAVGLDQHRDQLLQIVDTRALSQVAQGFHAALTSACRSRQLIAYCDQLFVMADRYRYVARGSPKASSKDRDMEHRLIAEAVIARRADEAVALLSRHFETTATLCQNVFRRSKTAKGAKRP